MSAGISVRLEPDDRMGDVYVLLRPLRRHGVEVPAGFRSDGASVPRFFWRVVFPPGDVHALAAAFVHDFLYRTHPVGWSRKAADEVLLDCMIEDGVYKHRAKLAYWGVRLFGGRAWSDGGKSR